MRGSVIEYFKLLSKYMKHLWVQFAMLIILLAGSIVLQLVNPQIIRFFIDAATKGKPQQMLTMAAVFYIGAAVLQQILNLGDTYLCQNIGWTSTNELRLDLAKHCLNLDMAFHKSKQTGEIIERIDGDVNNLFNFFSKLFISVLNNFILFIGIQLMLFREDWRVGVSISIFSVSALAILWKIQGLGVKYWKKNRETEAKLYGFLGEHITGTEDIRSMGASNSVMKRFFKIIQDWYSARKKASMMSIYMWMITDGVFAVGNVLALGIGGYLWSKGVITIGTAYLIFSYMNLLVRPIEEIRTQLEDLQKSGASIARIEELLRMKPAVKFLENDKIMIDESSIKVENVFFGYEKDVPVLKNISFNVENGKVLGVLGHTGSGKTTLARLIVRLYDPISGQIKIGDNLLNEISLKELRTKVAYVTQEVQLFKATVRDNLTFFNIDISDETIMNAIEEIGIREWFDKLPSGLDTMLDAEGSGLSAGEAQLLAFVRVFLKNPKLIILDEASSRLDPATEQLMEKAIDKLLKNRSCVIIAHRLWTVHRADDILILENGNIIEYGSRKELENSFESKFHKLLQTGMEEVLV